MEFQDRKEKEDPQGRQDHRVTMETMAYQDSLAPQGKKEFLESPADLEEREIKAEMLT